MDKRCYFCKNKREKLIFSSVCTCCVEGEVCHDELISDYFELNTKLTILDLKRMVKTGEITINDLKEIIWKK